MCILTCIYTDEMNTSSLESVGEEQQKDMRIQARSSQETMNLVGETGKILTASVCIYVCVYIL